MADVSAAGGAQAVVATPNRHAEDARESERKAARDSDVERQEIERSATESGVGDRVDTEA